MPGSMHTDGIEELDRMLENLGNMAGPIAARALYDGAAVVADAYAKAVQNIKTGPRNWPGNMRNKARYALPEEKAALAGKTGVARFNNDGGPEINTLVGVAEGYVQLRGRPVAVKLLARSINSGTWFMKKQPVFRKAQSSSKSAAQQAMVATADALIEQITK